MLSGWNVKCPALTPDPSGITAQAMVTVGHGGSSSSGPTIAQAATATLSSDETSAALSVLGADPAGETSLTYTWAVVGTPPADVIFSDNGDNSAKDVTATFSAAGSYTFEVTVSDGNSAAITSDVTVLVQQVASSISDLPDVVSLPLSTSQQASTNQFACTVLDQFGNAMTDQVTWSCSGDGTIDSATGEYLAPTSGTSAMVTATADGFTSNAASVDLTGTGPSAVSTTTLSDNLVSVSWSPVAGAAFYRVFSSTTATYSISEDSLLGDGLSSTTFLDNSVTAGQTVYYKVYSVDDSGAESLVGECYADIDNSGYTTNASRVPPRPATPTNVAATGVNDLELLVSWQMPSLRNLDSYEVDISTTANGPWSIAGYAENDATNYIIRTQDYTRPSFLTIGTNYFVRVRGLAPSGLTGAFSNVSNAATPIQPTFNNAIAVCGGNNQSMSYLLAGLVVQPSPSGVNGTVSGTIAATGKLLAGQSIGSTWFNLICDGFNAFITADPHDGGDGNLGRTNEIETEGAPAGMYPILDPNGFGLFEQEIADQQVSIFDQQYPQLVDLNDGIVNIGMLGYSHGGGMISNLSQLMQDNAVQGVNVVVSALIDGVEYGTSASTGYYDRNSLGVDPEEGWDGTTYNYWEPNGYFSWVYGIRGEPLSFAINNPPIAGVNYAALDHSSIAVNPLILNDVLSEIEQAYP